jgi:hypothetical protein
MRTSEIAFIYNNLIHVSAAHATILGEEIQRNSSCNKPRTGNPLVLSHNEHYVLLCHNTIVLIGRLDK